MRPGDPAPDFELPDQDGRPWRLSAYQGRVVALIFYPRDHTPVCKAQMCSLRDRWEDYAATGAEVVGISVGSVASHRSFAGRHDLPQRLLADERGEVTRLFGLRSLLGGSQRAVVVVDAAGRVRSRQATFPFFRPADDDVLAAIREAGEAGAGG